MRVMLILTLALVIAVTACATNNVDTLPVTKQCTQQ